MARTNGGNRLDDAARAGWLYYVAGNTQDEIAHKLGVSRQSAQRLVSLAVSEKLIKFRLDHPIARCMELSGRLSRRFGLQSCEIVPSDPGAPESITGVAIAGAAEMEKQLDTKTPRVIAVGTGRVLRACVEQLPSMDCPQHHLVSLVGNTMPDGSATAYNVVVRMAERVGGRHNPMLLPCWCASRPSSPYCTARIRSRRPLGCAPTQTRPSSGSAISMAQRRSRWTGSSPMRKAGRSSAWARLARSSAGSSIPGAG